MPKKTQMNFEDKMDKLQEIVNKLEKDDIDLDTSLKLYQEGLDLTKTLKNELNEFEEKIKELNNESNK